MTETRIQELEKLLELKSIECNEWREKYDTLANTLESDVKVVTQIVSSIINGDFTPVSNYDVNPILQPLKTQVEALMSGLATFTSEISRVTTDENFIPSTSILSGNWTIAFNSVSSFVQDTSTQYEAILELATSVANGKLDKKVPMTGKGKQLELQQTLNVMVDQLHTTVSELNRVAYEVGIEGKLGGSWAVRGIGGVWRDLVNNIGILVHTFTSVIRSSHESLTAIYYGDFSRRMTLDLHGELYEYKDTMNTVMLKLEDLACLILTASESRRKETETEAILRNFKDARGGWKRVLDSILN